jgi:hypothetical protein
LERKVRKNLFLFLIVPITLPNSLATTVQLIPRIKVAIEHLSHI